LFLLVPGGCYVSTYHKGGKIDMSGSGYQEMQAFSTGFSKALYKARLEIFKHEFAGLMMIKAYDDGRYKVAFFSELGLNFFDFELVPIQAHKNRINLRVNSIYEPLNKKILIKRLEKYFSMLLSPGLSGEQKSFLKKDGSRVLIRTNTYKGRDGYISTNLIAPYTDIVNIGGPFRKDKVHITLSPQKIDFAPKSILIEQPGLRLSFSLELVE
jgi:hypothetical protein